MAVASSHGRQRNLVDMGVSSYGMMIIDAGTMHLPAGLVARGIRGGQTAARNARNVAEDFFMQYTPFATREIPTIVLLFGDVEKLAAQQSRDPVFKVSNADLYKFIHGIDSTDPLTFFEIVDASQDAYKAGLRKIMRMLFEDSRCRKVVTASQTWRLLGGPTCFTGLNAELGSSKLAFFDPLEASEEDEGGSIHAAREEVGHTTGAAEKEDHCRQRSNGQSMELTGSSGLVPTKAAKESRVTKAAEKLPVREGSNDPSTYGSLHQPRGVRSRSKSLNVDGHIHPRLRTVSDSSKRTNQPGRVQRRRQPSQNTSNTSQRRTSARSSDGSLIEEDETSPRSISASQGSAAATPESPVGQIGKAVKKNKAGQRIDPEVRFESNVRLALQGKMLCNNYHLRGSCPYGDTCRHKHGNLSNDELRALKVLARGAPCRNGAGCEDTNCFAGHRCPYRPCREPPGKCYFPDDMHFEDTKPVE